MVETNTTEEDLRQEISSEKTQLFCSVMQCRTDTHIPITAYCKETLDIQIETGKAPDIDEFIAFLQYGATTKRMNELVKACPDADCLYQSFFDDIIQKIWRFICRLNGAFRPPMIHPSIAKKLLHFRDGEAFQYKEVGTAYDRLYSFAKFVKKIRNEKKFNSEYLKTHDRSDIKISMSPSHEILDKFIESISETSGSNSANNNYASHGRVGSIEVATTPDAVLSFLDSARLNEDDELVMNLRDQIRFLNCPYTMGKVHEALCR